MNRRSLSATSSRRRVRRALWAGAGLAATAALAVSCRSTGTPAGEMDDYRRALANTAPSRTLDESAVDRGVERFVAMFNDFRPEPVFDAALALYAEDAHFDDGFALLEGNRAIADYLKRSAGHVDGLDVVIADTVSRDGEVYVRWEMRFAGTDGGLVTDVPGISHLRFDDDGRVIYHRDHWDASGALADRVPAIGRLLRWIKSRV